MTTSLDIADAIFLAIRDAGTQLGERVFKPGDWPSQPDQWPLARVRLAREERQSAGRGGPDQFTTTAWVMVTIEASAYALEDNQGAAEAEAQLWTIKREIDAAILNNPAIGAIISQFVSIRSSLIYSSESATHLAGLQIDLGAEFFEGGDGFGVPAADAIDTIEVSAPDYPGLGARFFNLQN